jgi:hypothetical protein
MWGESRGETMSKASNAVYKWQAAVRKTRILKGSSSTRRCSQIGTIWQCKEVWEEIVHRQRSAQLNMRHHDVGEMGICWSGDLFQLRNVECMWSSVEENGDGCCGIVEAEIGLHEELLRRNRNGDTTKGDKTKYGQTNSIDFVKRTDNVLGGLAHHTFGLTDLNQEG